MKFAGELKEKNMAVPGGSNQTNEFSFGGKDMHTSLGVRKW
jgi:hypothetical protein